MADIRGLLASLGGKAELGAISTAFPGITTSQLMPFFKVIAPTGKAPIIQLREAVPAGFEPQVQSLPIQDASAPEPVNASELATAVAGAADPRVHANDEDGADAKPAVFSKTQDQGASAGPPQSGQATDATEH